MSHIPHKIPAEDWTGEGARRGRRHVAMLIRRADWLSRQIRARPDRLYYLSEFDALVWALTCIAGAELVNKWLGVIDRAPDHLPTWDEHTPSSMKEEIEPEAVDG